MRAKEFIFEAKRSKTNKAYHHASPGSLTPNSMDNPYTGRYYDFYRMGNLSGMDPDDLDKLDPLTSFSNRPIYNFYTDIERDKVYRAMKKLGHTPEHVAPEGSTEHDDTNTTSPVKGFKGYAK